MTVWTAVLLRSNVHWLFGHQILPGYNAWTSPQIYAVMVALRNYNCVKATILLGNNGNDEQSEQRKLNEANTLEKDAWKRVEHENRKIVLKYDKGIIWKVK